MTHQPESSIAIFYDRDFFPDHCFFKAEKSTLLENYDVLNCEQLADAVITNYTTLIIPYSGVFPVSGYKTCQKLLNAGGDLIVLGNAPFEIPCTKTNGKWQFDDPLHIGYWRECWASEWRNNLGLAFYMTPAESEYYHQAPTLKPGEAFSDIISNNLENITLHGSLHPLQTGRKAVVYETDPWQSPAPEISDFVTIVEPLQSKNINGRVLCVGFSASASWTGDKYSNLISNCMSALKKDKQSSINIGLSLKHSLINQGNQLQGEIWQRSDTPFPSDCELVILDQKGRQIFSHPISAPGHFSLPIAHLHKGAYKLNVQLNQQQILTAKFAILDAADKPLPSFKATRQNGHSIIEKDGQPLPAGLYAYDPLDRELDAIAGQFADAGVKIQHFLYPLMFGWKGPDEYDWSYFDSMAERTLRQDPEIILFPRFLIQSPPWWDQLNQEEMKVFYNGKNYIENRELAVAKACASSFVVPWSKFGGGGLQPKIQHVSFYSDKYLEDMTKAIKAFADHMVASPWKHNIAGIFFGSGACGEWGNFSELANLENMDYSKPAMEKFRNWLNNHYPEGQIDRSLKWQKLTDFQPKDVKLPQTNYLQKTDNYHHYFSQKDKFHQEAQVIPPEDIANARPPEYARRHISKHGFLKDPGQSWDTIEHIRWQKEEFAKMIGAVSRNIKCVFPNSILTGTFAGYLLQEFYLDLDTGEKTYAFQNMLADENGVDIVVCPHYYKHRELVTGDANVKMATGSLNQTSTIFLDENDQRTCLSTRSDYLRYGGTEKDGLAESIEAMKRNFIARLSKNIGYWWYDLHGHGWYAQEKLMDTVKKTQQIYENSLTPNPNSFSGSSNRINIIYSHDSYEYICSCTKFPRLNTAVQCQKHFNRNGFEWDSYFVEDVDKAPNAKAWFFLNAFKMEAKERQWIDQHLKKDGNILIWLYAQGLYQDDQLSLANSEKLTGIKTSWDESTSLSDITLTELGQHELALNAAEATGFIEPLEGLPEDTNVAQISPEVYYDDPDVAVLGNSASTGRPAFVVKDFATWKSVAIAAPMVPNNVMRKLLQWHGMKPVLSTPDAFYCNGDFIGINAREAGEKRLSFPDDFVIENQWTNETLTSKNNECLLSLKKGETFIGRVYRK